MKEKNHCWKRSQVTLRLTPTRLAKLRAIASRIGPDATPTDAVCQALAEAPVRLAESAILDQLDAIEELLETTTAERRLASDRLEAAIDSIAQSLSALQTIMEAASQGLDEF